jgi:putative transcriptional regulator
VVEIPNNYSAEQIAAITYKDWSQVDLAKKLKVSRQTINVIETGKYDTSLDLEFRKAYVIDQRIEVIFSLDIHEE